MSITTLVNTVCRAFLPIDLPSEEATTFKDKCCKILDGQKNFIQENLKGLDMEYQMGTAYLDSVLLNKYDRNLASKHLPLLVDKFKEIKNSLEQLEKVMGSTTSLVTIIEETEDKEVQEAEEEVKNSMLQLKSMQNLYHDKLILMNNLLNNTLNVLLYNQIYNNDLIN